MPKSGSRKKGPNKKSQKVPQPAKKPPTGGDDDPLQSDGGGAVATTASNAAAAAARKQECVADTKPQKNVELSAVSAEIVVAAEVSSEHAATAAAATTEAEQQEQLKPCVGEERPRSPTKAHDDKSCPRSDAKETGVVENQADEVDPVVVAGGVSPLDTSETNKADSSVNESAKKKKPNNKKRRQAEKAAADGQSVDVDVEKPVAADVESGETNDLKKSASPIEQSAQGTDTEQSKSSSSELLVDKIIQDDESTLSSTTTTSEKDAEKVEATPVTNDAKKSASVNKVSDSDSMNGSKHAETSIESVSIANKAKSVRPVESVEAAPISSTTKSAKTSEKPEIVQPSATRTETRDKENPGSTKAKSLQTAHRPEPKSTSVERQQQQTGKPSSTSTSSTVELALEQRSSAPQPSAYKPAAAVAVPEVVPRFYAKQAHQQQLQYQLQQQMLQHQHQHQHQQHPMPANRGLPVPGAHIRTQKPIKVEKDFIFTRIPKYPPRRELAALEAVDYKFDDSLNRREAQLLRLILSFSDFTGPCEYVQQMQLIIEIEDAFAQRDQWKHIKRQMAVVKKFRDHPDAVPHEWVDISQDQLPCFVDVGDRVLLTSGVGRRFGNSIREHQRNQLLNNVYATIVHKVDGWLCIAPNSPLSESSEFTMQYVLNRMNYQLERYALERLYELRLAPLLFPMMDLTLSTVRADSLRPLQLYDAQLDDVQSLAVRSIVAGVHHPRPFVLSGVAGSGKTRVIVESILQLHRNCPRSRILITSAANNILDELLLTLHSSGQIPEADFLRLNSATAGHTDAGENPLHNLIDPHDDWRAQNLGRLSTCVSKINTPSMADEVMQARLVLCTLSVCGRIAMSHKLKLDNFTHIFVVKAEAANESTCLVPLCCLSGQPDRIVAHVVLCGDTAQLGPIVKSPVAKRMHYGRSLLERLEGCPLYSRWDGVLSVRLRRNYRSLPELLELPNMLSYNGQMEAGVHYTQRMKAELSATFAGYPILFHSVENGVPVREPRSCSWSNVGEANIVIAYVYYYMDLGVSVDDIGIITPYKQQMKTIQKGIVDFSDTPHRSRLRIGSVEEFQGREKKIIIVSTVRNNKLGFINSRKRINVMLTRATSMLIIVGNGEFLSSDMSVENDWKDVIRHCRKQPGAFISTK